MAHNHHAGPGETPGRPFARWTEGLFPARGPRLGAEAPYLIGVFEGEGIGPDVVGSACRVLEAVSSVSGRAFEVRFGGPIGKVAERLCGTTLPEEAVAFCADVFAGGGAVLAGAGGGRFVYELRRRFDLFCKISPIEVSPALVRAGRLKPEHVHGVDLLIVRENASGIYQGRWSETHDPLAGRRAEHAFSYAEAEVRRILDVGALLAAKRRGRMEVIYKDAGLPTISALWRDCAAAVAARHGVDHCLLDIDHAAFRLVQHARESDVIVAPNLFGDVLSDLAAVLLGSRGLSYSGNFSASGAAVYQTNHGAGYDLVDLDRANPVGQILSLAMLLRESFGLLAEAHCVERAVERVWRQGWRPADLHEPGCQPAGTRELSERVAEAVAAVWNPERSHEAASAPH